MPALVDRRDAASLGADLGVDRLRQLVVVGELIMRSRMEASSGASLRVPWARLMTVRISLLAHAVAEPRVDRGVGRPERSDRFVAAQTVGVEVVEHRRS